MNVRGWILSVMLVSAVAGQARGSDEGVRVTGNRVEAKYGIRLASETDYATSVPLAYDQPYMVRKENGAEYRLWLHDAAKREAIQAQGELRGAGRYALSEVSGETTLNEGKVPSLLRAVGIDASVPNLELRADGTYAMGSVSGHWRELDGKLVLDGALAAWGAGMPVQNGEGVAFSVLTAQRVSLVLKRLN
ncbi:MAG: hypothetical protein ACT4TC_07190 [Myxococcaceae bacterium]